MTTTVSGPMFEPAKSAIWESMSGKSGAHYNNYGCLDKDGMAGLRQMFPSGIVDEMNFVLFSTSGVHGTYGTIEEAEEEWRRGVDEDCEPARPTVTFLIVHPRICCLRHGNCRPSSVEDFAFVKQLREQSWSVVQNIGKHRE